MKEEFDVTSIGEAAVQLQQTTKLIGEVAELLKIKPKAIIDGVPHFCASDVTKIALAINKSAKTLNRERQEQRLARHTNLAR